ncbi:putative nuclease HARBI1 isoform X1 [Ceratitis capitata]|uniref:putative nuclease HARBI1 isoform X1 n=1 Tax=Ceratitis capitata TaxID=7213 RepID=UPI00032A3EC8|nr:putative nuclease HARBI1 isoform X1 [Ceratitis capitata]
MLEMERMQRIRVTSALFAQQNFIFKKKIKILLLKLLNNLKIIHEVTSIHISTLLQAHSATFPRIRKKQSRKYDRDGSFWEAEVPSMNDNDFKDKFRLKRNVFQKVCEKVRCIEKEDSNMRSCIPLHKRVAIALFALGSVKEYNSVAEIFGVGRTTVGEIVLDFCKEVCEKFADCFNSYPPSQQEIERVVDGFAQLGLPQVFGAVGGCHIEIRPPKDDEEGYRNKNGWNSVILLASCDHLSKFTYVNIGSKGGISESDVFENSTLKRFHENEDIFKQNSKNIGDVNVPILLIADSSFCLSRYMMQPFPHSPNQTNIEKNFNSKFSKCHRKIEDAFDQLKARFRKLTRRIQVAPKNVNTILKACCILHNFLKLENDEVSAAWIQELREDKNFKIQPKCIYIGEKNDTTAIALRSAITLSLQEMDISVSRNNNAE